MFVWLQFYLQIFVCLAFSRSNILLLSPNCKLSTTSRICFCFYGFTCSCTVSLTPYWWKTSKSQREKCVSETTSTGFNASNVFRSWSLNACALSLPLNHSINSLFHLPLLPSSCSLIHLISTSWFVRSPPLLSTGLSSSWLALLTAPHSGSVVSLVESDCAGGREVNWKKLCCSHRGAEARENKLDISPILVGWLVYTIYPNPPFPNNPQQTHECTHSIRSLKFCISILKSIQCSLNTSLDLNMCPKEWQV